MGVPVRLSPTCSSLFSCLPLPWLLPAPSLRRAWRPLRLSPMSMTPLAMSLLMIPLQLSLMSMMPLVTLLMLPPLKPRLTSMMPQVMLQSPTSTRSPSPLLPHLPSLTPPTLTPTAPTPTWPLVPTSLLPLLPLLPSPTPPTHMLDTPTPWLPTTPAVSTTLAALCPAPKRFFKIETERQTKDRKGQRTTGERELDIGGHCVGPTVSVGPLVSAQDLDN